MALPGATRGTRAAHGLPGATRGIRAAHGTTRGDPGDPRGSWHHQERPEEPARPWHHRRRPEGPARLTAVAGLVSHACDGRAADSADADGTWRFASVLAGAGMSGLASRSDAMPAEPALAALSLPDPDLASMRIVRVPDFSSPIDDSPGGEVSLGFGLDRAPAPRVVPADQVAPWQRQFAVLLAEALAGVRPLQHVLPWMSERGNMQLRRLLPVFCCEHRPRILRVLTAAPNPGVIEMTIVVTAGPRTRALAARLERAAPPAQPASHGQVARRAKSTAPWLCTDVEAA